MESRDFERFYFDYIARNGEPPSAVDFSTIEKERQALRDWARRNRLPLTKINDRAAQKYEAFYRDWITKHGKPPCCSDYGETKSERRHFWNWANARGLPLSKSTPRFYYIELANKVEPLYNAGLSRKEIAARLNISVAVVGYGVWMLQDDGNYEDDPRACEPDYVKQLCDELRERDCIPPRLLPEEWSRYLDIRNKRIADGTYGAILDED